MKSKIVIHQHHSISVSHFASTVEIRDLLSSATFVLRTLSCFPFSELRLHHRSSAQHLFGSDSSCRGCVIVTLCRRTCIHLADDQCIVTSLPSNACRGDASLGFPCAEYGGSGAADKRLMRPIWALTLLLPSPPIARSIGDETDRRPTRRHRRWSFCIVHMRS